MGLTFTVISFLGAIGFGILIYISPKSLYYLIASYLIICRLLALVFKPIPEITKYD
jgi:hypothetical protein